MEEKQISIDGETRILKDSFTVIATENPVETVGTFPLPAALLDRFAMKIIIGYPDREDEKYLAKYVLGHRIVPVQKYGKRLCKYCAIFGMDFL